MQPLAVFEEVTGVIGIEAIPPFLRIGIEALLIESGDGVLALGIVLRFGVEVVGLIRFDVVPGVEFEDVVCGEEIARAELEGIGAFEVGRGVVRAVRWGQELVRQW